MTWAEWESVVVLSKDGGVVDGACEAQSCALCQSCIGRLSLDHRPSMSLSMHFDLLVVSLLHSQWI